MAGQEYPAVLPELSGQHINIFLSNLDAFAGVKRGRSRLMLARGRNKAGRPASRASNCDALSPNFPWGLIVQPKLFTQHFVSQGVHGLPKTIVHPCREFSQVCQLVHWLGFPGLEIIVNEVHSLRLQNEISAVNQPTLTERFFLEAGNLMSLNFE